ncbi:hypothetical protein [Nocardia sp.]|uniref:hypothetical protein n=1 Tax=Nocardia sp. TaxID=1821 RepID=UPI00261F2731|nr:hypothetical protein [Nocardia sp.]
MTEVQFPRLAEVFPDLVTEIVGLLEPEDENLARTVRALRFYGRCTCTPTCPILLTAPLGSPSGGVVILESDGESIMFLWIDPTGPSHRVIGIELLDGRNLVLPPA